MSNLDATTSGEITIKVKLLFQLQGLVSRVCLSGSFRSRVSVCQNKRKKIASDVSDKDACTNLNNFVNFPFQPSRVYKYNTNLC